LSRVHLALLSAQFLWLFGMRDCSLSTSFIKSAIKMATVLLLAFDTRLLPNFFLLVENTKIFVCLDYRLFNWLELSERSSPRQLLYFGCGFFNVPHALHT
jgi:hypothetical protein